MKKQNPKVAIIMGSDSDLAIMQEAVKVCEDFNVSYEVSIMSAHRTPDRLVSYAKGLETRGLKVLIAGAGGAAHLAGMTAALTTIPIIGIPIKGKTLDGIDSLLSIVQMPPGIPVATVGINAAKNAGLLALKILALNDEALRTKLKNAMLKMGQEVNEKAKKLEKIGVENYLNEKK